MTVPLTRRLRSVLRNSNSIWELRCPRCEEWAEIDDDQLHGRVSVWHDPGCGYHETKDWWMFYNLDRFDDVLAAWNAYREGP